MRSLASRRSRQVYLPFVLLGPAVAWLLSLSVSYVVHDFVCAAARTAGDPAPLAALRAGIVVVNVVLLLVALGAGILAVAMYRASRRPEDEDAEAVVAPTRFAGVTGIALAVLFAFGIVLIGMTPVAVGAC